MFHRHCSIIVYIRQSVEKIYITVYSRDHGIILHSGGKKKEAQRVKGDLSRRDELSATPPLPKIQIGLIARKIFGHDGTPAMRINKLTEGRE